MSKKTVLEMFKDIKEVETADDSKITVEDLLPFFCKKVEQALQRLEAIKNANPSEAMECFKRVWNDINTHNHFRQDFKDLKIIENYILKAQTQEKENELLKEIIRSFFDKGCPLHQYIDKDFGLTIEVDNECSIMHLGEFKGIDLDIKLKEVLESE